MPPGAVRRATQHKLGQCRRHRHRKPTTETIARDQQLVTLAEIDRHPRPVSNTFGGAGGRTMQMYDTGVRRESQGHSLRQPAQAPLNLFAIEEIFLSHEPNYLDESAPDQ